MFKRIIALLTLLVLCVQPTLASDAHFTAVREYTPSPRSYEWGPVELIPVKDGETVSTERYAGSAGRDYTDRKTYTFRLAAEDGLSLNWNPHGWTNDASRQLTGLLSMGLYALCPNIDRTGYAVMPELAADMPMDVTGEYVGSMGIAEGDAARAWRITLNPDAHWTLNDDARKQIGGSKALDLDITADDYLYSMRELLNPKLNSPRARTYCEDSPALYNAYNYVHSGEVSYVRLTTDAVTAIAEGKSLFLDMDFWDMTGAPGKDGVPAPKYVSIDDDTLYLDAATGDDAWLSAKQLYETYLAVGMPYESEQTEFLYASQIVPETHFEDVGIRKADEYAIDLIFESPVEDAAAMLPMFLLDSWLVYEPLYEACKTFVDAEGEAVETDAEAAAIQSDYCRSLETTATCGPYALTACAPDGMTLQRDDAWYGYGDGRHCGMYQTDAFSIRTFGSHNDAREAFLAGELDMLPLQIEDMETYGESKYLLLTSRPETTKFTFTTNFDRLRAKRTFSHMLVVDEFREGMSWAIDRKRFARQYTLGGTAGLGLFSAAYICDPYTGLSYRASEAGKRVIQTVYRGDDDGYDVREAQHMFSLGYDRAVAARLYDGMETIDLDIRVYENSYYYTRMFYDLNDQLRNVCAETGLKDKLSLIMTYDPYYYLSSYAGNTDVIFSTWQGPPLDPYSAMAVCYTDAADGSGRQMEFGFDASQVRLTFDCGGQGVAASLRDWARWANREAVEDIDEKLGHFTDYAYATRCEFLAGMEACLLNWHVAVPLYDRNDAALLGQRVRLASRSCINALIGFGGAAYITYTQDDARWAQYAEKRALSY